MRLWIALAVAVLLGIVTGMATAVVKVRLPTWVDALRSEEQRPAVASPELPSMVSPKVEVDEDLFKFGVMDTNATGKHDFKFVNVGHGPLQLTERETSCSCAVSKIDNEEIAPGRSGIVTVEWKGKGRTGAFRHTATIGTNDPNRERVVLTVEGRMTKAVQPEPSELVFSRIVTGEEAIDTFRVFGFLADGFELTGYELDDPETADHFEVGFEELPLEQVEEDEEEATCGYLVTVRVKSGLPLGRFRQTIRLQTDLESASTIEVPVTGSVQSEVSIVGGGWNDKAGVLTLGTVPSGAGGRRTLLVVVGGPHRGEIEFHTKEVVPDLLEVELGSTKEARDGSVTQTPVTVSVPPGSRPANYLGPGKDQLGKIMIETSHPNARLIKILVRFAVQG